MVVKDTYIRGDSFRFCTVIASSHTQIISTWSIQKGRYILGDSIFWLQDAVEDLGCSLATTVFSTTTTLLFLSWSVIWRIESGLDPIGSIRISLPWPQWLTAAGRQNTGPSNSEPPSDVFLKPLWAGGGGSRARSGGGSRGRGGGGETI